MWEKERKGSLAPLWEMDERVIQYNNNSYNCKKIKTSSSDLLKIHDSMESSHLTDLSLEGWQRTHFHDRTSALTSSDPKGGCRGFPHTRANLSNCQMKIIDNKNSRKREKKAQAYEIITKLSQK